MIVRSAKIRALSFISFLFATFSYSSSADSSNPENSIASPGRIFELLALNNDLPTAARPKYRSPCDIKARPDGKFLYVVERTAKTLAVIDFQNNVLAREILLPNEGTGAAVSPDGKRVYVTCSSDRWPNGMVCEVDPGSGKVLRRLPAGQGARSPVISHDGKTLYVCNQFGGTVSVIDVASGALSATINALREPFAAAITPDDSVLVVTNLLPVQKATDTLNVASKILLFDAKTNKLLDTLALPTGSNSVFGVAVTPDGRYALATHLIAMFSTPASMIDGGWIHTNNIAIVDIKGRKVLNDASLDLPTSGAGNPWGISVAPDGNMACIALSGANFMSVVDLPNLLTIADTCFFSTDQVRPGAVNMPLYHDLTKLAGITDRITVRGKEPRAMAVVGNQAVTAGYFDDYMEIFDLVLPGGETKTRLSTRISLGPEVPKTSCRAGECSFYDASLSLQKWQSCHSCHPLGRTDCLNSTVSSDHIAPKNMKSVIYSWWTPPTSWAGRRENAFESIRAGIKSQLFLQPDPIIAATMDTFFMAMKPVPSPNLIKGRLSVSALRGKEIFYGGKAGCAGCHSGPLFTDKKLHEAGVLDMFDANLIWDTPSLIECWRTAPYNHLGSASTVKEMVGITGMSGASKQLTQEEMNDLVEFVLSL